MFAQNYRRGVLIDRHNYSFLDVNTVVLAEYEGVEYVGNLGTLKQLLPIPFNKDIVLYAVEVIFALREPYREYKPSETDIALEKKFSGQPLTDREKQLMRNLNGLWDTGV